MRDPDMVVVARLPCISVFLFKALCVILHQKVIYASFILHFHILYFRFAFLALSSVLTIYSMLEAGGWTWPRSLLCRSRMRCLSPSLMALLPLDLAFHHPSFLSLYLSRIDSSREEFLRTVASTLCVRQRIKPTAPTQTGPGGDLFMMDETDVARENVYLQNIECGIIK